LSQPLHWREVLVPPELVRDHEMMGCLRGASPTRVNEAFWKLSRAPAHRKVVVVIRMASVESLRGCPRESCTASGIGLLAIPA